jgi:hypothetical protein
MHNDLAASEEQVSQMKEEKSRQFDSVMLQQQRVKYFSALKDGKIKPRFASVEETEESTQEQLKQLQSLNAIIEYFLREHPEARN